MNFAILQLAFVRGVVVGFALAAPMGPVAMLCVRRTLTKGRLQALAPAFGAAIADTIFGAVAGLGITAVATFVKRHEIPIGLIGGLIVLITGIATWRAPITMADDKHDTRSLERDVLAAFSMAITNPATMGAAAGLFAAFGSIDAQFDPSGAFWLVAGVFGGSSLWWLMLVGGVGLIREGFLRHRLARLNRIFGAIIAASGATVLALSAIKAFHHG